VGACWQEFAVLDSRERGSEKFDIRMRVDMKKQPVAAATVEPVEAVVARKIKAILDRHKCTIKSKIVIENNNVSTEIVISRIE
jgi:hypothetical protein